MRASRVIIMLHIFRQVWRMSSLCSNAARACAKKRSHESVSRSAAPLISTLMRA